MFIYLKYAESLPFTGGEIIYVRCIATPIFDHTLTNFSIGKQLDAIFTKPKMFFYTLYGITFIFLNGSTNCLQFGAQVFLADLKDPASDQRLVRLFAIFILTVVCCIVASSNRLLGFLKFVGLLVLIGKGVVAAVRQESKSFTQLSIFNDNRPQPLNHFLALSNILFAYNGWENATFVLHPPSPLFLVVMLTVVTTPLGPQRDGIAWRACSGCHDWRYYSGLGLYSDKRDICRFT